jgi:dolichol kinase
LNTSLKMLWMLFHGLAAVKLIRHLLCTFPSCASIGEALLVTSGLVLYFGDFLACTIAKVRIRQFFNLVCFHCFYNFGMMTVTDF